MKLNLFNKNKTKNNNLSGPYVIKRSNSPLGSAIFDKEYKTRPQIIKDTLFSSNDLFLSRHLADMHKRGLTEIRRLDDNNYHFFYKDGNKNFREEWNFIASQNGSEPAKLERKLFTFNVDNNSVKHTLLEHQKFTSGAKSTPLIKISAYHKELNELFENLKTQSKPSIEQLPSDSKIHSLSQSIMGYELNKVFTPNKSNSKNQSLLSRLLLWRKK